MDDKYNKIAREALLKTSVILPGQVEAVAQALRDVEAATVHEVCEIVKGQYAWHDTLEEAICERFGLKD